MKTLSVITPTFNRAYCLHQVYESLCRQSSDDFLWIIVDDGSSDNTRELVDAWIKEGKVEIRYTYKTNGGMHTARNLGYEMADTLLNIVIDSDDWMTDDAVERIIDFWQKNGNDTYYGIVSNDITPKGQMIGTPLPAGIVGCTSDDLFGKYGVRGDKKFILRSDLSRLYPYPVFPGEKFYPASYKFRWLDQKYQLLLMNEYTCVVDYNEDSMTFDKFKQYRMNAHGFAHYRNEMMKLTKSRRGRIKLAVHYVAESKFAGERHYIRQSAKPWLVALCALPGNILYFYLKHTARKY